MRNTTPRGDRPSEQSPAMRQEAMSDNLPKSRRKGAVPLGELIRPVIDPVVAKRGFATADLLAAWPEIVGPAYAECSAPERIAWPRTGDDREPGVLFLKVEGPRAIFVQHELPQITERINAFFGYRAIGQVRIVQAQIARKEARPTGPATLPAAAEAELTDRLTSVGDERLRAALERLGRGVLGDRRD